MNQLQHVEDRVIVEVNMNYKNSHVFDDGTKIVLERKYDNFNARYTQPVNAVVLSAKNIPEGSEVIIHHNSAHESNRINNFKQVSGSDIASDIRYFSIPESECFVWRKDNEWQPLPGYDFGLRIFKPYSGMLEGIEPTLIPNVLFITTGEYKNKVCYMLRASDYELIFQGRDGKEKRLIRCRTEEDAKTGREMEIVAIHNEYTEMVLRGDLLVGLTKTDCKPLKEMQYV